MGKVHNMIDIQPSYTPGESATEWTLSVVKNKETGKVEHIYFDTPVPDEHNVKTPNDALNFLAALTLWGSMNFNLQEDK